MGLIDMLNKKRKETEDMANMDLEDTRQQYKQKLDDKNIGTLKGLKDLFKKKKEKEERGEE